MLRPIFRWAVLAMAFGFFAKPAPAQDTCKNRGELDTPFCDENGDLLADSPRDARRIKDPDTLFFSREHGLRITGFQR